MTIAGLLDEAAAMIAAALGSTRHDARVDAYVLAAFAWKESRAWFVAHDRDTPDAETVEYFRTLVERRRLGEPVAYIVGTREFHGRPFRVTPDVLIPRPETELLVERALAALPTDRPAAILDLGTGSGCLAVTLALERPAACVVAIDRSIAALAAARANATALGATIEWLHSNWFDLLGDRRFDIIVGNPPYVATNDPHLTQGDLRFEPAEALAAGQDGLADIRRLIVGAPAHLHPRGTLLLEHGHEQATAVRALLSAQGFEGIASHADLAGIPRVSGGQLSE